MDGLGSARNTSWQSRPPSEDLAVFVDGCFFHGCPHHYVRPRTRGEFWSKKLAGNIARDRRQTLGLEAAGWKVVRIWECEVRADPQAAAEVVIQAAAGTLNTATRWVVERVESTDSNDPNAETRHLVDLRDPTRRHAIATRRSTRKQGPVLRLPDDSDEDSG